MREPGFYWVAVRIPNTPTEEISYLTIANYCEDGGWEAFESDGFALREEPSEFDYWIEQVYPPRLEPPAEIIDRLVKASRLKYPLGSFKEAQREAARRSDAGTPMPVPILPDPKRE